MVVETRNDTKMSIKRSLLGAFSYRDRSGHFMGLIKNLISPNDLKNLLTENSMDMVWNSEMYTFFSVKTFTYTKHEDRN